MSDVTGYLVAAYILAFATIFGYAAVVIVGNRAAARRLAEARARHENPGSAAAEKEPGALSGEAVHV
jgi:hypothetical protein